MNWREQSVFVTGATGFIGGRLCERLVLEGVGRVRALLHDVRHAPRVARLPIQLVSGDLLNRTSLRDALRDTNIVIHLGLGFGPGILRGTRHLLDAAQQAHVTRLVHMSTTAVYGLKPPPGSEAEAARPRSTGNVYCDNKLRAERAVLRLARRGFPAVILRPAIVYGPYSRWCSGMVEKLRQGRAPMIDGGKGICNTTYVDNLVDAIFLALDSDRAVGEVISITDGELVSWGDFIRAHATMMRPRPPLPEISSDDVLAYHRQKAGLWRSSWRRSRELIVSQEFRELLKRIPIFDRTLQRLWYWMQTLSEEQKDALRARLVGSPSSLPLVGPSTLIPDLDTWAIQTVSILFSIEKATNVLGYKPRIPFTHGIELTEQWLRWANYV